MGRSKRNTAFVLKRAAALVLAFILAAALYSVPDGVFNIYAAPDNVTEETSTPDDNSGETSEPEDNSGEASEPDDNSGETSEPEDNSGETTDPDDESGEVTDPGDESGEATDPEDESGEATNPEDESGEATDPGDESGEATDPGDESGEATDPEDESGEVSEPGDESGEATDPGDESGEATDPGDESGEATDPGDESGEATDPDEVAEEVPGDGTEEVPGDGTEETSTGGTGGASAAAAGGAAVMSMPSPSYTVIFDPGDYGKWDAVDETYTSFLNGPMPEFHGLDKNGDPIAEAGDPNAAENHEPGWTFTGWTDEAGDTYSELDLSGKTVDRDIELTAEWAQIEYTIKYVPKEAGLFQERVFTGLHYGDETPAFDGVKELDRGAMRPKMRPPSTFEFWTAYQDKGEGYGSIGRGDGPDSVEKYVTRSREYFPNYSFTIQFRHTFTLGDRSGSTPGWGYYFYVYKGDPIPEFDSTVANNFSLQVDPETGNPLGKPGWKFVGWTPEPPETAIEAGANDAGYWAKWEKAVEVTFRVWDDNAGDYIDLEPQTVTLTSQGSAAQKNLTENLPDPTAPNVPARKGYTFTGWDMSYSGSDLADIPDNELVVTAEYEKISSYTVHYVSVDWGQHWAYDSWDNPWRDTSWGDFAEESYNLTQSEFESGSYNDFSNWRNETWGYKGELIGENDWGISGWSPVYSKNGNEVFLYANWGRPINVRFEILSEDDSYSVPRLEKEQHSEDRSFGPPKGVYDKDSYDFDEPCSSHEKPEAPEVTVRDGYYLTDWEPHPDNESVIYEHYSGPDIVITAYEKRYRTVEYLPGDHGTFGEKIFEKLKEGESTPAMSGITGEDGWEFDGWDTKPGDYVTDDAEYTATWKEIVVTPDKFTVQFVNWDGTPLDEQQVEKGGRATAPADPTRVGHYFTGWDKEFANVTENITVTARYEKYLTVKYLPGAHGTFAEASYSDLELNAPTPDEPVITGEDGWVFDGWDTRRAEFVTEDAVYTATWKKIVVIPDMVTVEFVDWDGTPLGEQQIEKGTGATAPADPTRDGYYFTGWDKEFTNVTADITVTAQYEKYLTVKYLPGGHGTFAELVYSEVKMNDSTPQAPSITGEDGWNFDCWDIQPVEFVTEDAVYTAKWTEAAVIPNMVTVQFVNWDGVELKSEQIEKGADATAPEDPTRDGHYFTGWDKEFTQVQESIVVTAVYGPYYTVRYLPGTHGTFAANVHQNLKAGDPIPAAPSARGESGWRFDGWVVSPQAEAQTRAVSETVTRSMDYTAQWERVSSGGNNNNNPDPNPNPDPTPDENTDRTVPNVDNNNDRAAVSDVTPTTAAPVAASPTVAPAPAAPVNTLVPNDTGGFIEIGEDGVPLGEWEWDDDTEDWVFIPESRVPEGSLKLPEATPQEEPRAELPKTDDAGWSSYILYLIGLAFICAGAVIKVREKKI